MELNLKQGTRTVVELGPSPGRRSGSGCPGDPRVSGRRRAVGGNWDSGWLVLRTDGVVVYRRCDPYTLAFEDRRYRCPVRWFVGV